MALANNKLACRAIRNQKLASTIHRFAGSFWTIPTNKSNECVTRKNSELVSGIEHVSQEGSCTASNIGLSHHTRTSEINCESKTVSQTSCSKGKSWHFHTFSTTLPIFSHLWPPDIWVCRLHWVRAGQLGLRAQTLRKRRERICYHLLSCDILKMCWLKSLKL